MPRWALVFLALALAAGAARAADDLRPGDWVEWHATLAPRVARLPWITPGNETPDAVGVLGGVSVPAPESEPDSQAGPVRIALRLRVLSGTDPETEARVAIQIAAGPGETPRSLTLPLSTFRTDRPAVGPEAPDEGTLEVGPRTVPVQMYALAVRPDASVRETDAAGAGGGTEDSAADVSSKTQAAQSSAGEESGVWLSPALPFGLARLRTETMEIRAVGFGREDATEPPFPLPIADATGTSAAAGGEEE